MSRSCRRVEDHRHPAFRDIRPFFETDEQLEAERNASGGWMLHAGILSGFLDREEEIEKVLGDPNSELNRRLDNLVAAYDAYFRSLVDANVVLEGYLSHQTFTSPSVRPSIEVIQRSPTRMGPLEATSAQYEELGRSGRRVSDAYQRMDERAKRVEVVAAETQKWAERIELAVAVLTVAGGAYVAYKEAAKQGAKQAWRALGKYVFKTGATLAAGQVVISPLISTLQKKLGLSEESIRLGTLAFMIIGMHRSGRRPQREKPSSTADESAGQTRLRNEPQFDENISQETSGRRTTQPYTPKRNLRKLYTEEVAALREVGNELLRQGVPEVEVAKRLHQMRRNLEIKYKDMTPPDLLEYIYRFNIDRYGDKLGPTFEYLTNTLGKTPAQIIESASRPLGDERQLGAALLKHFGDAISPLLKKYDMI